jgi:hypothetical protein
MLVGFSASKPKETSRASGLGAVDVLSAENVKSYLLKLVVPR